jgi:hypothetical protein
VVGTPPSVRQLFRGLPAELALGRGFGSPAAGLPARVAIQVLEHSQLSMTIATDFHPVPESARGVADQTGEALWANPRTRAPLAPRSPVPARNLAI